MHPHPDSSKFPPLTLQGVEKLRAALSNDRGNGTGVGCKFQMPVTGVGDVNSNCEGPRQQPAHDARQRFFAAASGFPRGQGGVGAEYQFEGPRGTYHDVGRQGGFGTIV